MESRSKMRRWSDLGVYGHQPGISAHGQTEKEEQERIVEAILKQKVGSNHKTIKQYREYCAQKAEQGDLKTRIRIARIATRTVVKWERPRKLQHEGELQSQLSSSKQKPTYESRTLTCSRCGTSQETTWMQLRTTNGYRAIHCKGCKKQETVARTKCQCDVIWHRCETHRNDPETHSSKKG